MKTASYQIYNTLITLISMAYTHTCEKRGTPCVKTRSSILLSNISPEKNGHTKSTGLVMARNNLSEYFLNIKGGDTFGGTLIKQGDTSGSLIETSLWFSILK